MFSGIIEEAAPVVALKKEAGNLHITMTCSFVNELSVDQSVHTMAYASPLFPKLPIPTP